MQTHNRKEIALLGNVGSALLLGVWRSHVVIPYASIIVSSPYQILLKLILYEFAYSYIWEFLNQTDVLISNRNTVLLKRICLRLFAKWKIY